MTLEATLKQGEYFYLLKNLKEPMLVCTEPNSTSMKALELSPLEPIVQEHVIIISECMGKTFQAAISNT